MAALSLNNWAVQKFNIFTVIALVGFATLVVYPTLSWDVIQKIGVVKSYFWGLDWSPYVVLSCQ